MGPEKKKRRAKERVRKEPRRGRDWDGKETRLGQGRQQDGVGGVAPYHPSPPRLRYAPRTCTFTYES